MEEGLVYWVSELLCNGLVGAFLYTCTFAELLHQILIQGKTRAHE